jgi:hypothetical protein
MPTPVEPLFRPTDGRVNRLHLMSPSGAVTYRIPLLRADAHTCRSGGSESSRRGHTSEHADMCPTEGSPHMTDLASRELAVSPRLATVVIPDRRVDSAAASMMPLQLSTTPATPDFLESTLPHSVRPSASSHREFTVRNVPNGLDHASERDHNSASEWSSWDDAMADVAAHLMSAHQLLSELADASPYTSLVKTRSGHVSLRIRTALASLDDCASIEASGPYSPELSSIASPGESVTWHALLTGTNHETGFDR